MSTSPTSSIPLPPPFRPTASPYSLHCSLQSVFFPLYPFLAYKDPPDLGCLLFCCIHAPPLEPTLFQTLPHESLTRIDTMSADHPPSFAATLYTWHPDHGSTAGGPVAHARAASGSPVYEQSWRSGLNAWFVISRRGEQPLSWHLEASGYRFEWLSKTDYVERKFKTDTKGNTWPEGNILGVTMPLCPGRNEMRLSLIVTVAQQSQVYEFQDVATVCESMNARVLLQIYIQYAQMSLPALCKTRTKSPSLKIYRRTSP